MKIDEIIKQINGEVVTNQQPSSLDVAGAMGADLMSDVLAAIEPEAALLTGLCNPQVVRTALIADVRLIIFVRGKQPAKETIELADQENMPLITTPLGMFEACGILYQAGISCYEGQSQRDCSDLA